MFAIAFDLVVAEVLKSHPKSVAQAYADIGQVLGRFGFGSDFTALIKKIP
jgi:virulence-associated protein VapD